MRGFYWIGLSLFVVSVPYLIGRYIIDINFMLSWLCGAVIIILVLHIGSLMWEMIRGGLWTK